MTVYISIAPTVYVNKMFTKEAIKEILSNTFLGEYYKLLSLFVIIHDVQPTSGRITWQQGFLKTVEQSEVGGKIVHELRIYFLRYINQYTNMKVKSI